jgi:signal transduction histidine kinase
MNIVLATASLRTRPWLGYVIAVLAALLVVGLRLSLRDTITGFPFLMPFVAVTLVSFIGGPRAGVLTAVVAGLLTKYHFIAPVGTLALDWPAGVAAPILYALLCAMIIALIRSILIAFAQQQRSEAALRALNATLEQKVAERTAALETEMEERSATEAQLRHLQKIESIGRLSGGIAHDFNNNLAIVIGSLDLARRRLAAGDIDNAFQRLDHATEGAQRAASLTERLLAYARQQPLAPQPIAPNGLLDGMSELLRRTIGECIAIETRFDDGLWQAFADPGQLENAVVNLALNARDAMPGGGCLVISTANAELDAQDSQFGDEPAPGAYVKISVADSGIGMSPEAIERAFDPFYTTKEVGQGTGLGLSQVFGFLKQSGGHVRIASEVGTGTTVELYLPRHGEAGTVDQGARERHLASAGVHRHD